MLTQGPALDPKCKLNISSFLTVPHLLDCLICTRISCPLCSGYEWWGDGIDGGWWGGGGWLIHIRVWMGGQWWVLSHSFFLTCALSFVLSCS